MKKGTFWAVLILLMLLLTTAAVAETFHVSPQSLSLTGALALARDGDTIVLAEGTYSEPKEIFPLSVAHRVTICAEDGADAVIDAPAFVEAFRVTAERVTLRGLDIRFRHTGVYAIGDDLTLMDCRLTLADSAWRTSSCGVWLGGVAGANLSGCAFTGCGVSMAGPPLSEASEGRPVLTGLFEVGEDAAYFTSHTITNCTVNDKPLIYQVNQRAFQLDSSAGEVILAGCADAELRGLDVSDGSIGITLAYCENIRIVNCKADRCGIFGIYSAYSEQCQLDRCTVETANHGIDLRASRTITVNSCKATNCDQGIFFSFVEDSIADRCTVTGTGQGYFFAGGARNGVVNCEATACENGLHAQKEGDLLVNGCVFNENTVCAVRMDGSRVTFVDNTVRSNWVGAMAYGNTACTMANNLFDGNKSCGLYLRAIAFSHIVDNRFVNSERSSVQTHGEMNGTALTQNELDIPPEHD